MLLKLSNLMHMRHHVPVERFVTSTTQWLPKLGCGWNENVFFIDTFKDTVYFMTYKVPLPSPPLLILLLFLLIVFLSSFYFYGTRGRL